MPFWLKSAAQRLQQQWLQRQLWLRQQHKFRLWIRCRERERDRVRDRERDKKGIGRRIWRMGPLPCLSEAILLLALS